MSHIFSHLRETPQARLKINYDTSLMELVPTPSVLSSNLISYKPASELTLNDGNIYNTIIQQAIEANIPSHSHVPIKENLELELATYCSALEICDEDAALHGRVAYLMEILENNYYNIYS